MARPRHKLDPVIALGLLARGSMGVSVLELSVALGIVQPIGDFPDRRMRSRASGRVSMFPATAASVEITRLILLKPAYHRPRHGGVLCEDATMQPHELFELVIETLAELATLHTAAAAAAERARSLLDKHDMAALRGVLGGDQHRGGLPRDSLVVNPATFTVEWHGQYCNLGQTILFRLIQHLARRPGRYFSYDILMEEVWERRCSNATVRSAVKRLRRAISEAGMAELAAAIKGQRECYGVFLDDNCS